MKRWNKYPLFFLLLLSICLITGAGYAGEDTIYAAYTRPNGWMTPELSLVFQGWKDGVYPWMLFTGGTAETAAWETAEGQEAEPVSVQESAAPDGTQGAEAADSASEGLQVSAGELLPEGTADADSLSGNAVQTGAVSSSGLTEAGGAGISGNFAGTESVSGQDAGPRYDKFGNLIAGGGNGQGAPGTDGAAKQPSEGQDAQGGSPEGEGQENTGAAEGREDGNGQQESESKVGHIGQSVRDQLEQPDEPETYEFTSVSEGYFDDALFIGDSRTVGLDEYGGFQEETTFYAATSFTIYNVFESPKKVARLSDGKTGTIEEALAERQFGKIYIMLGINELGRGTTESFFTSYANAVNRIRQLQPDAIIFVQGIMRVSAEKSASDAVFNNAKINERNAALEKMADDKNIFYLEVNDAVCDENGDLIGDYTFDQIHLKAKYYQLWKDYLFAHGIVKE